ncbi:XF1762 family protein [Mycobacterium marinum]|uniref:XF1762 family protein n=1 Tax=Mycobacterium marinum TaxID=1781 RepID=UPI002AB19F16|nr:XF1762 family protein [Mycobacterium marinum]
MARNHRHHTPPVGHKFSLGYRRLITYTLASESGASLRGSGWRVVAERSARPGWDTPGRQRLNRSTEHGIQRTLWEAP